MNHSLRVLSQNMLTLRKHLHITQAQLAEKSNISEHEISKLECRLIMPKLDSVDKIANGFGLLTHQLLTPDLLPSRTIFQPSCQCKQIMLVLESLSTVERSYIKGYLQFLLDQQAEGVEHVCAND